MMSKMKELLEDIKDELRLGVLSDVGIARKFDVPLNWVTIAWEQLCSEEDQKEYPTGP